MGNIMGNGVSNGLNLYLHPEITPDPLKEPKNNPLEGFDKLRKERTVKATKAEMESAKIPLQNRDYCVDELLRFKACRKDVWPFAVQCEHEKHAYLNCQYEDYVIRMKEYERERRLMERSAALNAAA
ncbi:PREDICTED: NADH dehydrogenase [ubiquinone] 1 beta subcomplex subunit 7-like [Nicrophorus vespilloides]|uniref:NADH dehydrogenase [ubiquinone] 1 beta subcomplex subunit 7 n=1 Tax=Nicrophorus vespilloides TaxID=110193 RepID=A0ABM1MB80_NICVS|nr:PREDICTED: NADH dehydrogenase [ubiquinone] 1 beta subcomplex subunit 7-like [Nicrophorus vespilloides]